MRLNSVSDGGDKVCVRVCVCVLVLFVKANVSSQLYSPVHSANSVSYTHLDVYKRQVINHGPRPNSPDIMNNSSDTGRESLRNNFL